MKAAETSADLDEAEWEEVTFYQTEVGWGGVLMNVFLSLIAGCTQGHTWLFDANLSP